MMTCPQCGSTACDTGGTCTVCGFSPILMRSMEQAKTAALREEMVAPSNLPCLTPPPCQLPCPKCGSGNIYREFHEGGSEWDNIGFNKPERHSEFVVVDRFTTEALEDCITHHCRCCQYEWETKPL